MWGSLFCCSMNSSTTHAGFASSICSCNQNREPLKARHSAPLTPPDEGPLEAGLLKCCDTRNRKAWAVELFLKTVGPPSHFRQSGPSPNTSALVSALCQIEVHEAFSNLKKKICSVACQIFCHSKTHVTHEQACFQLCCSSKFLFLYLCASPLLFNSFQSTEVFFPLMKKNTKERTPFYFWSGPEIGLSLRLNSLQSPSTRDVQGIWAWSQNKTDREHRCKCFHVTRKSATSCFVDDLVLLVPLFEKIDRNPVNSFVHKWKLHIREGPCEGPWVCLQFHKTWTEVKHRKRERRQNWKLGKPSESQKTDDNIYQGRNSNSTPGPASARCLLSRMSWAWRYDCTHLSDHSLPTTCEIK